MCSSTPRSFCCILHKNTNNRAGHGHRRAGRWPRASNNLGASNFWCYEQVLSDEDCVEMIKKSCFKWACLLKLVWMSELELAVTEKEDVGMMVKWRKEEESTLLFVK